MLATLLSAALQGISAETVTVEVNSNTPVLTLAPMSLTIFRIKL